MAQLDAAASDPFEVLIERAGYAVAREALSMLGGAYGRRVVIVAGKGNNGADGRAAAKVLERRGVRCEIVDASSAPSRLPAADLVIDAAYGTGLRDEFRFPSTESPVLAVDIPSGIDGLLGIEHGRAAQAQRTVTFAALKPGHLLADGAASSGEVSVADIGIDCRSANSWLVTDRDAAMWLPRRPLDAHKWHSATFVVGGSAGMYGAASLAASAAARTGAGYVLLGIPGGDGNAGPVEAVGRQLPAAGWSDILFDVLERAHSLIIGPGLGRSLVAVHDVQRTLKDTVLPVVVDGDALSAIATGQRPEDFLRSRRGPTVLTPHDGEFAALTGSKPGDDRFAAVRTLAIETGATVLLKGPTTLIGDPSGEVLAVTSGDERLASAGSGDVLSGIIGALLAKGVDPSHAAAAGAHLHGLAGQRLPRVGAVASDLLAEIPAARAALMDL